MERNEIGIFSKTPDSIPLFLLKIKIKTQPAQTKNITQSWSTFIRISGPVPEVKKSALIS